MTCAVKDAFGKLGIAILVDNSVDQALHLTSCPVCLQEEGTEVAGDGFYIPYVHEMEEEDGNTASGLDDDDVLDILKSFH